MATTEISWDGIDHSYVPPRELRVHESLRRHTDADDRVDPITHEVLRHALWNVNTEHGNTIMKISGSPICAYGHDFNPSILDENGDFAEPDSLAKAIEDALPNKPDLGQVELRQLFIAIATGLINYLKNHDADSFAISVSVDPNTHNGSGTLTIS